MSKKAYDNLLVGIGATLGTVALVVWKIVRR